MNIRAIVTVLLVIAAFFAGAFWQRTIAPAQPAAQAAPPGMPAGNGGTPPISTGEPASVGLVWDVPVHWTDRGESQMRLATYDVPSKGGAEAGECAVFYFGPSQGGEADANIDRWIGQFEKHGNISRSTKTIGGMTVKLVQVDGDYLAPSGPMMQSSGTKKGWSLIGAIVDGPNGSVFFKFTGPKDTVHGASKDFDGMLASLRKG